MSQAPPFRTKAGLKRSYCDQCDKSFSRSDSLRYHKRRHHRSTDERPPFVCTQCDKGYAKSFDLNRHLEYCQKRRHYYHCVECDGSFRFVKSLKKHYYFVHELNRNNTYSNAWAAGLEKRAKKSFAASGEGRSSSGVSRGSSDDFDGDDNTELDDDEWYAALTEEHVTHTHNNATPAAVTNTLESSDAYISSSSPPSQQRDSEQSCGHTPSAAVPSAQGRRASLFSMLERKFDLDDSTAGATTATCTTTSATTANGEHSLLTSPTATMPPTRSSRATADGNEESEEEEEVNVQVTFSMATDEEQRPHHMQESEPGGGNSQQHQVQTIGRNVLDMLRNTTAFTDGSSSSNGSNSNNSDGQGSLTHTTFTTSDAAENESFQVSVEEIDDNMATTSMPPSGTSSSSSMRQLLPADAEQDECVMLEPGRSFVQDADTVEDTSGRTGSGVLTHIRHGGTQRRKPSSLSPEKEAVTSQLFSPSSLRFYKVLDPSEVEARFNMLSDGDNAVQHMYVDDGENIIRLLPDA